MKYKRVINYHNINNQIFIHIIMVLLYQNIKNHFFK